MTSPGRSPRSEFFPDPPEEGGYDGTRRSSARLSPCGTYRYHLSRRWGVGAALGYCMLNPSTADASIDDATIVRCSVRARRLGYPAIEVVNIFALRATDPRQLQRHPDPVGGPLNDSTILSVAYRCDLICAWGPRGTLLGRDREVLNMLSYSGFKPLALRLSRDGHPLHPLYLPYDIMPRPLNELTALAALEGR